MSAYNPNNDTNVRHFLSERPTVFGFRDGLRGRPFLYDFRLDGYDPADCGVMYEHGRAIGVEARTQGVDPGFYPEGQPSQALIRLVLTLVEWREMGEFDNDKAVAPKVPG